MIRIFLRMFELVLLVLQEISSVNTFPNIAIAGDTVALGLGWKKELFTG